MSYYNSILTIILELYKILTTSLYLVDEELLLQDKLLSIKWIMIGKGNQTWTFAQQFQVLHNCWRQEDFNCLRIISVRKKNRDKGSSYWNEAGQELCISDCSLWLILLGLRNPRKVARMGRHWTDLKTFKTVWINLRCFYIGLRRKETLKAGPLEVS